jgi:hypothetical protein
MFEQVSQSANHELMAAEVVVQLCALGHQFRPDLVFLHGGPQSGLTGQTVFCGGCRKKFKFKRVSERWALDQDSADLLKRSCADFKKQNISDRNRLDRLIARFSKSSRFAAVHR